MNRIRVPVLTIACLLAVSPAARADRGGTTPDAPRILARVDPGVYPRFQREPVSGLPLHAAALEDDVPRLERLLATGLAVDARDKEGRTPLMVAVAFDSRAAVAFLLENQANPSARDATFGDTPLHFAALAGRPALARLLIAHGARVDVRAAGGATPLHYAALYNQRPMIRLLLTLGAEINAADDLGLTALQYAGKRSRQQAVTLLRAMGARPDTLFDAIRASDIGRVNELVRGGADVDQRDMGGTALHLAAARGHAGIVEILIAAGADVRALGDPIGATPLHLAALADEPRVAAVLLKAGADIEARDEEGRTPLMAAAIFGSEKVVALLIGHGADTLAVDRTYGDTVIHYAALSGDPGVTERLIAAGVDVNTRNRVTRSTPMHYAASQAMADLVRLLAARGADLAPVDIARQTPLQRARAHNAYTVMRLLNELGAPM